MKHNHSLYQPLSALGLIPFTGASSRIATLRDLAEMSATRSERK